jgi:hypothetical protein
MPSLPSEFDAFVVVTAQIIALGIFATLLAIILGYFLNKGFGAFFLGTLPPIVLLICVAGYLLFGLMGYFLSRPPADLNEAQRFARTVASAQRWGSVGLFLAVMIVTGLGALIGRILGGSKSGKRRGAFFVPALWLGLCSAGWIGHKAGGWIGLFSITLPAVAIFWLALYILAHYILPLDEDQSVWTALRCLLTFSLGTNYPYYTIEDRQRIERVPGNQFAQFFAGPGIFLTSPDYAVAVSDGRMFKGVRGPGVVFTNIFESTEPVELRPQQRSYKVEASTRDGIPLRFTVFGPFQLDAGDQRPGLGKPFPFRASSIFKALLARPIDISRGTDHSGVVEERKRRGWDDLYEMIGTHVMQDIVAQYKFDELCAPFDPEKDPRNEIAAKYLEEMRKELPKYGIKIPGGGVSNLLPADQDEVIQQRIQDWQARWQHKMLERRGKAEAKAVRFEGQIRAQIQAEMIQYISEAIAEVATEDEEVIIHTVALRFIDSLNQMVTQPHIRERLSPDVTETLGELRIIGGE